MTKIEESRQQLLSACNRLRSFRPWIQDIVDHQVVHRDRDLKRISIYLERIIIFDVPKAIQTVSRELERGGAFYLDHDDFMSIQEGFQIIRNSSGAALTDKELETISGLLDAIINEIQEVVRIIDMSMKRF